MSASVASGPKVQKKKSGTRWVGGDRCDAEGGGAGADAGVGVGVVDG